MHKFRIKLYEFKVHSLAIAELKVSKPLYIKVEIGDEKHTSYVEKNAQDTVEWHSTFATTVTYGNLNELSDREVTIVLWQKNKGLFAQDTCLGGFKVDFLTLATGPAFINMPIQSSNSELSGRMSMTADFEHFSEARFTMSDMIIESSHSFFNQAPSFFNSSGLAVGLEIPPLPDMAWPVCNKKVYTYKERGNSWKNVNLLSNVSIRSIVAGLQVVITKKDASEDPMECTFHVKKYFNLESKPNIFEEKMYDSTGNVVAVISGIFTVTKAPFLSQMVQGTLTELGVKDPMVIYAEVPLPRCAIYRSTVDVTEPPLPWVRVNVLDGSKFYFSNETLEKRAIDVARTGKSVAFTSRTSSVDSGMTRMEYKGESNPHPMRVASLPDVKRGVERAAELAKASNGWICSSCTYVNEGSCEVCSICSGSWSCRSCTYVNDNSKTECTMCTITASSTRSIAA